MADNKTFFTRLQLKYDTYSNWWNNRTKILLKGEVAICAIPSDEATTAGNRTVNGTQPPQILFKVGDGTSTWEDLPWASGKAADVFDWAKKQYLHVENVQVNKLEEYRMVKDADKEIFTFEKRILTKDEGSATGKWGEWTSTGVEIDLNALEEDLQDQIDDHETRLDALEALTGSGDGSIGSELTAIKNRLTAIEGNDAGSSMREVANAVVVEVADKMANTFNHAASTKGGVSSSLVQEDGKVTSFNVEIAAETFDAYGSASAVDGKLTTEVNRAKAAEEANTKLINDTAAEIRGEIAEIKYDEVDLGLGTEPVSEIKYFDSISQSAGKISVGQGSLLVGNGTNKYSADNHIATIDDIADVMAGVSGAMQLVGTVTTKPVVGAEVGSEYKNGDVVLYTHKVVVEEEEYTETIEYVVVDGKWQELGNESLVNQKLKALKSSKDIGVDSVITNISQVNGSISVTTDKIVIAQSQVSGLTAALEAIQNDIDGNEKDCDDAVKAVADRVTAIEGTDAGKSMRTVANEVVVEVADKMAADITNTANDNGGVSSSLVQEDGKVTGFNVKIAANTFDAYGSASAVDGKLTTEVNRAKAAEEANTKLINDTAAAIRGEIADLEGTADAASVSVKADTQTADFYVLTKVVEEAGKVSSAKSASTKLAKVANTGNIADLVENTATTYVIFNCGSASTVI